MVFVVLYVFTVAFRGISKEENLKMKPKGEILWIDKLFHIGRRMK